MSLPPMDVAGRLECLRPLLAGAGCEALLVTNLVNVAYLSGFRGTAGLLLVLPEEAVLATDGRYGEQAEEQLAGAGVSARLVVGSARRQKEELIEAAGDVARLGLEATDVTWARQQDLAAEWFPALELVATRGLVEELRQIKDAGEVARVAEAAAIADRALGNVGAELARGPTEQELALALEVEMRRLGATGPAFASIVASGPNGAKPHATPSDRVIGRGEMVVVDFGAVVDGYRSDMTRTICLGPPGSDALAGAFSVVAASQRAGVEAVAAGKAAADVDRACRQVIHDAGLGPAFVHGTGHGVGLDIHEAPALAKSSGDTLAAGHVVTVEPGVYLRGQGGVRIEDTVVVTDDGCRPLTLFPKELSLA